jgi:hypothetical protein
MRYAALDSSRAIPELWETQIAPLDLQMFEAIWRVGKLALTDRGKKLDEAVNELEKN